MSDEQSRIETVHEWEFMGKQIRLVRSGRVFHIHNQVTDVFGNMYWQDWEDFGRLNEWGPGMAIIAALMTALEEAKPTTVPQKEVEKKPRSRKRSPKAKPFAKAQARLGNPPAEAEVDTEVPF